MFTLLAFFLDVVEWSMNDTLYSCHDPAVCLNNNGSYMSCECVEGIEGDGVYNLSTVQS